MNKAGRKSKYFTHVQPFLKEIEYQRKFENAIEADIAKNLGVALSTFSEYKIKYPELMDALKTDSKLIVWKLSDTIIRKALGQCTFKEVKKYIEKDKTGREKTRIEEIVKEIPPDTVALIFSLKSLAPHKWRDSQKETFIEMSEAMNNFKLVSDELTKHLEDKTNE